MDDRTVSPDAALPLLMMLYEHSRDSVSGSPAPIKTLKRVKIGRNKPCPCGSGIKYKKCCIDK